MIKPLLKWAGGKSKHVKLIQDKIDTSKTNYVDLFVGGGSIFLAFSHLFKGKTINDGNSNLINFYEQLRDSNFVLASTCNLLCWLHNQGISPKEFKLKLFRMRPCDDTADFFTLLLDGSVDNIQRACRTYLTVGEDPILRGACFWYCNRTAFRGLMRENDKGYINSGFTRNKIKGADYDHFELVGKSLQDVEISNNIVDDKYKIQKDSFYFIDPPYISTGKVYAKDLNYNENTKGMLSNLIERIIKKGSTFLLTCNFDMDLNEYKRQDIKYALKPSILEERIYTNVED